MSFKRRIRYLITGNMPIALPVIFLYRMFLFSVLTPLWFYTANVALRAAGYSYITLNNLAPFLLHPFAWIFLAFWLVVFAFLALFEQAFLIFSYSRTAQHLEFRFSDLFSCIARLVRHPVKRNVFGIALFSFLLEVLIMAPCSPFLIKKVRSLFAVLNFVFLNKAGTLLFMIGLLLLFYAALCRLFIVHYYTLENLNTHECAVKNAGLIRRNGKKTVLFAVLLFLVIGMATWFFYAALTFVVVSFMHLFMSGDVVLAAYMQFSDRLNYFFILISDILSLYIFERIAVKKFYLLKDRLNELTSHEEMRGYKIETNRLMRNISILMVVVMIIVTIASTSNIVLNGVRDIGGISIWCNFSAHKGMSAMAPENTIPAMEKAISATADYNELDVHLSKDGYLVVMHDSSFKRTCGVKGTIEKSTLKKIEKLDAGSFFSSEYSGTKVPLLDEVMELCKGKIKLNIDVKPVNGNDRKIAAKVVSKIHEFDYTNQCVVTSLSKKVLDEVKRLDPDIKTGYILNMASGTFYKMEGIDFFSLKYTTVTAEGVQGAHSMGREIWAWTVNDKDDLLKMQSLGVDNVITDNVVFARKVYSEKFDSHSIIGIVKMALTH